MLFFLPVSQTRIAQTGKTKADFVFPTPIYADGKIYFLTETEGESTIIEAGPEYKLVARNKINEKCKASVAVSQGNLFIRTEHNLICIGGRD